MPRAHDTKQIRTGSPKAVAPSADQLAAHASTHPPDDEPSPASSFRDPAFTENRCEPMHRWVPWVAGFSAAFVADCLDQYLPRSASCDATVLDPFAGVGTTLVEAYRRGCNAVGFEINPYAALVTRAKLEVPELDLAQLDFWLLAFQHSLNKDAVRGVSPPWSPPAGFHSRVPFFSPDIQRQVLLVLTFIRGLADSRLRDLFLVAFASVMVSFSNYSYEPSLGSRPGSGRPLITEADVPAIVAAKIAEMSRDCRLIQEQLRQTGQPGRRSIFDDSFFCAERYLAAESVDLAVTSPPYLNNYHYVRNTRPHMFWLDLIADSADLKGIETASFGRFWQSVRARPPMDLDYSMPDLECILDVVRAANPGKGVYGGGGWANYAVQYFNDAARFARSLKHVLKPGGRCVVVIGNSVLQGVEIRVDEFLVQIADRHGLGHEGTHLLRTKRVGNSIIRSSVRNAAASAVSLYEVAVVLKK
jgi:SAM-dependent methyltransferase